MSECLEAGIKSACDLILVLLRGTSRPPFQGNYAADTTHAGTIQVCSEVQQKHKQRKTSVTACSLGNE